MARLIVKSPYIKCGGGQNASGYLNYIATRERVEIVPDDRPPTRKQEQLIQKLVKDFPDTRELLEYDDYNAAPTKANASSFITLALEQNWNRVQSTEGYAKYIATRPKAERLGSHGLFGDADHVSLDAAMNELNHYTGNVWTHIISLKREDAARLGYDNAAAWRTLLRTHRNDIAAAMNIKPEDFRWYAAFHNEGNHPHVHMMAWSATPGQAYLDRDGIKEVKSVLTNQVFQQELLHLYEEKSVSRDELVHQTRQAMLELAQRMRDGLCICPTAEKKLWELSQKLDDVSGKKVYDYLPKPLKQLVDEVVDAMEKLPTVNECYQKWWELQCRLNDYYSEQQWQRPPLSQQKEFRQIKNAVIREAEHIRQGRMSFEDAALTQEDEQMIDDRSMSYNCWGLRKIIADESTPLEERDKAIAELKQIANQGDPHAQYLMGLLYRDGGLLVPDAEQAKRWLELSAQELPDAQYALGKLFLSDDLDIHDPTKGIYWLQQAADSEHEYAAYRLCKEYLNGKNVSKDSAKAAAYIRQAAEQANPYAQYLLGKLYLMGDGVPKDKEAAQYWFSVAEQNGHAYAGYFLDRMDRQENLPPNILLSAMRLLHHMGSIFRDNAPRPAAPTGIQIDHKRLQRLREKEMVLGHKWNDHGDEQNHGMGGMGM